LAFFAPTWQRLRALPQGAARASDLHLASDQSVQLPFYVLPHERAGAALLYGPRDPSVQQAQTPQEVKILSGVISGTDPPLSPADDDGRTLEV